MQKQIKGRRQNWQKQAEANTKNKEKYKNKWSPNQDKARGNTGRIVKDTRAGNTRSKHQEENTLPDNEGGKTTDLKTQVYAGKKTKTGNHCDPSYVKEKQT